MILRTNVRNIEGEEMELRSVLLGDQPSILVEFSIEGGEEVITVTAAIPFEETEVETMETLRSMFEFLGQNLAKEQSDDEAREGEHG